MSYWCLTDPDSATLLAKAWDGTQCDGGSSEADGHSQQYLLPAHSLRLLQRPADPQLRAIELLSRCRIRFFAPAATTAAGNGFGRLSIRCRGCGTGDLKACEQLLNGLLRQRRAVADDSGSSVRLRPLRRSAAVAVLLASCLAATVDGILRGSTFVHSCGLAYAAFADLAPTPVSAAFSLRVCNCVRLWLPAERAVTADAADAGAEGDENRLRVTVSPSVLAASAIALRLWCLRVALQLYEINEEDSQQSRRFRGESLLRCPPVRVATHREAALVALAPFSAGKAAAEAEDSPAACIIRPMPLPKTLLPTRLCDNLQLPPPPLACWLTSVTPEGPHFRLTADRRRCQMRQEARRPDYLADSLSVGSSEMLTPF